MSSITIEARISNFIHRQIATLGDDRTHSTRNASSTSGIIYEPKALPRGVVRKVQ